MQQERIYIVYTSVITKNGPFYHKDIYYERPDGKVTIFRGTLKRGFLRTQIKEFDQQNKKSKAELNKRRELELGREVLAVAPDLSKEAGQIRSEMVRINKASITYNGVDRNSNWAADKSILKARLPLPKKDKSFDYWGPGSLKVNDHIRSSDEYEGGDADMHFDGRGTNPIQHETEIELDRGPVIWPRAKRPKQQPSLKPLKRIQLASPQKRAKKATMAEKGPLRVDSDPSYNPLDIAGNGFEDMEGEVHLLKSDRPKFKHLAKLADRHKFFAQIFNEDMT